ncbi:MAG: sterol desaturase family protein [Hyphomicrobiales bacterium]|nr:sterol desaturase family protein [Hyphomicrobiales bacterium]
MLEVIENNEALIRAGVFLGILTALAVWEFAAPRRRQEIPRLLRWSNNLAIVALNTLLVRLSFPILAVGLAVIAGERGWGLLNVFGVPVWLGIVIAVVALDLALYLQHVMFHAVPAFWRLHRMHHADLEFDVTTGLRFHPVEILLSMGIKLAVVAVLGPPAVGVLIFEVLLNAAAMFSHSNIDIPRPVDRILRLFIVTPDMHRVHHSSVPQETNSNFGFNLSLWDRVMGTYQAQPAKGHLNMTIGIETFRTRRDLWLDRMLIQPVRGPAGGYPINQRDKSGSAEN